MTQSLRRFLLLKYGGCSDRRIKNPNTNGPIGIDDGRDTDAPSAFCWIHVTFPQPDGDTFELSLSQAPCDARVKDWATKRKAKLTTHLPFRDRVTITAHLDAADVTSIKSLAGRINTIPSRQGRSTPTNPHHNYPWLCRRTAASLRRFAALLEEYQFLKSLPPAPEKLEGLFAILAEIPQSPAHQAPTPHVPVLNQHHHPRPDDKLERRRPGPKAHPQSRPSADEGEDLYAIMADWEKETTPANGPAGGSEPDG